MSVELLRVSESIRAKHLEAIIPSCYIPTNWDYRRFLFALYFFMYSALSLVNIFYYQKISLSQCSLPFTEGTLSQSKGVNIS